MRIAVANSRLSKKWKNVEIDWETLKDKCSLTVRTSETVAEFRKMKKSEQDSIKDIGGFVGGALREGVRKNGYVEARSMLTLIPHTWE